MVNSATAAPQLESELQDVEHELHQFETQQKQSNRLIKSLVYPSLLAFIVLAAYGFYLIQSLTSDVNRLTNSLIAMQDTFQTMQSNVQTDMHSMVLNLNQISSNMRLMTQATTDMSYYLVGMTTSTDHMAHTVQQMNASTQNMALSMYNMQGDVGNMNQSFSSPFKMMSNFMPFGGGNKRQYIQPPVVTYYPQQGYYPAWHYLGGQAPMGAGSNFNALPLGTLPLAQPVLITTPDGQPPVPAPALPTGNTPTTPEAARLTNS